MSSKRRHANRNCSPHRAKRQHIEKTKFSFEDYKLELHSYIGVHTNIRDQEDFWNFYHKFKLITSKSSNEEKVKILNIEFVKNWKEMYDRLPLLYSGEQPISINYSEFKQFLTVIKVYQDFQQKTSFNKLKKIKEAQADLPIAKYKMDITENIQKHKVLLIAGKLQKNSLLRKDYNYYILFFSAITDHLSLHQCYNASFLVPKD